MTTYYRPALTGVLHAPASAQSTPRGMKGDGLDDPAVLAAVQATLRKLASTIAGKPVYGIELFVSFGDRGAELLSDSVVVSKIEALNETGHD